MPKNSDYTRVQLSLGSHEESLAHLQNYAGCALLPPTWIFDLEYFCSKELKNSHLHPSLTQDVTFL